MDWRILATAVRISGDDLAVTSPGNSHRRSQGRAIARVVLGVAAGLLVSGCSFSVTASSDDDVAYQRGVRESIEGISAATEGLHPVCDRGGNVVGCVAASDRLVDATDTAITDLEALDTPSEMADSEAELIACLERVGEAMDSRTTALQDNDDEGWRSAQAELQDANVDCDRVLSEMVDS